MESSQQWNRQKVMQYLQQKQQEHRAKIDVLKTTSDYSENDIKAMEAYNNFSTEGISFLLMKEITNFANS